MVDFLLFIIGKTSSGKDTIANYIKDKYGFEIVCSYTTRPKRDYEENGVQHFFIDDLTMDIVETGDVIAWTKNDMTGIRYCATTDALKSDKAVYIINPEGIKWFEENGVDVSYKSIYIDLDDDIIKSRALSRGDNVETLELRLASEHDEFNGYRDSGQYDYIINTDCSMDEMFKKVDNIMGGVLNDIRTL